MVEHYWLSRHHSGSAHEARHGLVRALLFKIEAAENPADLRLLATQEELPQAAYHIRMLAEAGYVRGNAAPSGRVWADLELTWAGHEFLDTLRDPTIWEKTKAGAAKLGGVGFDLLLGIAKEYIKAEAKQRLGLEL
jgi:hypothetical protein